MPTESKTSKKCDSDGQLYSIIQKRSKKYMKIADDRKKEVKLADKKLRQITVDHMRQKKSREQFDEVIAEPILKAISEYMRNMFLEMGNLLEVVKVKV